MRIFKQKSITKLFDDNNKRIINALNNVSEHSLTNNELEVLAESITNEHSINSDLELSTENSTNEVKMIPIPQYKGEFQATVHYHFSVKGNINLFNYQPAKQEYIGDIEVMVSNNKLTVVIFTRWSNDELDDKTIEKVRREIVNAVESINHNIQRVKEEIEVYNDLLKPQILKNLTLLKGEVDKKKKTNDSLNPFD